MGLIVHNFFGCGKYQDVDMHNELSIYVENASCLSDLINTIYEFVLRCFGISPDIVRFTHSGLIFHAQREDIVYFIQKELCISHVSEMISNKTLEGVIQSCLSEKQDFESFISAVKLGVMGLKGANIIKNGFKSLKNAFFRSRNNTIYQK